MSQHLKLFKNDAEYEQYKTIGKLMPSISHCIKEAHLHYKLTFCELVLTDESVVAIEGEGTLTKEMTSPYSANTVNVNIGAKCTSIGVQTFKGFNSLQSVTFEGNNFTTIGNEAFSGCTSLTNIDIPYNVTSIGSGAFNGCKFSSTTIPSNITRINDLTFANCSNLKNVDLPNGLTTIGEGAFYNCPNLTSINIPSNVTGIEDGAFTGCHSLTNINIPNSIAYIGIEAFSGCTGLTVNLKIPKGTVGNYAFKGCSNLVGVEFGSSVTAIGIGALSGCTSLTQIVSLNPTPPTLGTDAFADTNNCYIYVKDIIAYQSAWSEYQSRLRGGL